MDRMKNTKDKIKKAKCEAEKRRYAHIYTDPTKNTTYKACKDL